MKPLPPHSCERVNGPVAQLAPQVPITHARFDDCTPLNPHDVLHGPHADQSVKYDQLPAEQLANRMLAPPPQSPQSPAVQLRVWFMNPVPQLTLQAPNTVQSVHERGEPTKQSAITVPPPLQVPHVPLPQLRVCTMLPAPHMLLHLLLLLHADHVTGTPTLHICVCAPCPVQAAPQLPRQVRLAICVPTPHVDEHALHGPQDPQ